MIVKKLIYTAWTTLDGYLGDEDDGMSWVRGDDQMSEYEIGIVDSADTLMLGRKTYEDFYGYWPQVPDSKDAADWEKTYAEKLNALDKVVVSTSMKDAPWERSTIIVLVARLPGRGPSSRRSSMILTDPRPSGARLLPCRRLVKGQEPQVPVVDGFTSAPGPPRFEVRAPLGRPGSENP